MKETKPYLYHNTAYSKEPYFVCLHFPNLVNMREVNIATQLIAPPQAVWLRF